MQTTDHAVREVAAALALDLTQRAGNGATVFIDPTGERLDSLAAAAQAFAPGLDVVGFPAPDVLPYDRTQPSGRVAGQRVAAMARLAAGPAAPRLMLTSARAVMTLVPPPAAWADAHVTLQPGDPLDIPALHARLRAWGYTEEEHVDEPGQSAFHGKVIDLYPGAAAAPARLLIDHGRIQALHGFDPVSQRSTGDLASLLVRPVRELDPAAASAGPAATDGLVCILSYLPDASIILHPHTPERWPELYAEAEDAHAATQRARRVRADDAAYLPPPSRLFATPAALGAWGAEVAALGMARPIPPRHRPAELAAAITEGLRGGQVVVAAAGDALAGALRRRDVPVRHAADWADASAGPAGQAALLPVALDCGFARDGLTVLAASAPVHASRQSALPVEEPPRLGDIVVHRDMGVCRVVGLSPMAAEERVVLQFADATDLLVPINELGRIWRYGSEAGPIALDRLHGHAWKKRQEEIAAEIAQTARDLAGAAAQRARVAAPVVHPPPAPFAQFNRRFPYPLSPDQAAAIDAVLADLAAGHPMDRLVCGDVGFGKTEVALRAAAAAALAGYQVAVMAPTTVLARQHYEVFSRRFAKLGVRVAPLLRGASSAAAQDIRDGLADGSIAVVVGTQAIAAPSIRFKHLALVVIDEEQRFGDADKQRLAALRNPAGGVHVLVMTATPIPRTLQGAMVGLRQISVIATPPQRRRPTRTYVLPWDPVVVREALLREHGRGGQSFVICPRIEDLAPTAERLAELVPELSTIIAHGRQKPETLEQLVAEFAAGHHDVLLATNIIEAGLDIPRANTILITRPDRFGLSQLHQMRGRVGRGERRGAAYLLTEPDRTLPTRTERRLRTLQSLEQLGAGVTISMADMDARGAGDLFGDRQAGHVHAIGTELYQHLLAVELARAHGHPLPPEPPDLHTEVSGRIPEDLVPEPDLRLDLYRRLARMTDPAAVTDFAEELRDRFGELPAEVVALLDLARLRAWCASHGIARLDAGPTAVAFTLADPVAVKLVMLAAQTSGTVKDDRVIAHLAVHDPVERLQAVQAMLG